MKSSAFYAVIGLGVLAVLGIMYYGLSVRTSDIPVEEPFESLAPIPVSEGTAIYASGTYNFYVLYPENAVVEDEVHTASYHIPTMWRMDALPEVSSAPVVTFITYRVQNEHAYPRYYNALTRIGVSSDTREVSRCTKVNSASGEVAEGETMVGDTAFSTFRFESAGMMQYVRGRSYRTVHENSCYAIEAIVTGSSYREEGQGEVISDDALAREEKKLHDVLLSFRFATPQ